MRIAASTVSLSSQHYVLRRQEIRQSLRVSVEGSQPSDTRATALAVRPNAPSAGYPAAPPSALRAGNTIHDPRLLLLKLIVEKLTGRKIEVVSVADPEPASAGAPPTAPPNSAPTSSREPAGFSLEYERTVTDSEAEQTAFAAEGRVRTTDGQELPFRLELSMSRAFSREERFVLRAGDAARQTKDPLVINFGLSAAQLADAPSSFDLNADGNPDPVHLPTRDSGLLALDLNGDGAVNDGRELFGPSTGDGFAELAQYDADGNQWVDEGDPIYARVSVWRQDSSGASGLVPLGAAGVGAIYLGKAPTPFEVRDEHNELLAVVRSSSIYLHPDGSAGTVQQVDLVV